MEVWHEEPSESWRLRDLQLELLNTADNSFTLDPVLQQNELRNKKLKQQQPQQQRREERRQLPKTSKSFVPIKLQLLLQQPVFDVTLWLVLIHGVVTF